MDQTSLVETRIQAGEKFLFEFGQKYPVKTAFWLKRSEDSEWYLYVALDQFDDQNRRIVYADVRRSAKKLGTLYFDPFWVKIVKSDDPIAQAVLALQERYPPTLPTLYQGSQLGGVSIEGAFLYRLPTAVA